MFYNYERRRFSSTEAPGISVFCKDANGEVFHTYACYARGLDAVNGAYQLLDLVPKGRDEAGLPYPMFLGCATETNTTTDDLNFSPDRTWMRRIRMSMPMKPTLVRYRTRPEEAPENERLIEEVFRELHARLPDGVRYLVLKLADNTFVHFASVQDGANPVTALEAFGRFRAESGSAASSRRKRAKRPSSATIGCLASDEVIENEVELRPCVMTHGRNKNARIRNE